MKIEVTQEDIEKGVPECCDQCPVALAIRRLLAGDEWRVAVECEEVTIGPATGEDADILELPEEARYFIEDFDNGEQVEPFAFDLDYELTKTRHE